jgi:DNA-directed RNA polymerase specialized sigma24 family protein
MAKALGCSMGTVASRLSRGHKMLAERLKRVME